MTVARGPAGTGTVSGMKAAPDAARESSDHSSSKRALAAAVGAALFLAGVVVGRSTGSAAHTHEQVVPAPPNRAVEDALVALRRELQSLRASLVAAPLESPRAPAAAREREPAADMAAFEAAERKMEKVLLQLERRAARTGIGSAAVAESPGRQSLSDIVLEYRTRSGTPDGLDGFDDELTVAHRLWTIDDLIERYGMPRDIGVSQNGAITCLYAFPGDASLEPEPAVRFNIHEGRVTYASIDD